MRLKSAETGRRLALPLALCGIILVATLLGISFGPRLERATGTALIMLVLVVGLKVFIGDSGVFSFGQVAFMGVGAYVTAITTMSPMQKKFQLPNLPPQLASLELSGWQAALLAGAVATVVSIIVSIPLLRLAGLTASLATVAVLIAFHAVFQNWETYTRGNSGIILDATTPGVATLVAWACAAVIVALIFRRSAVGLRLAASREDEVAARSIGIRVWWERGVAYAVSSFIVGVAGSLFAQYFGSLSPESFYLTLTFTGIAMLVIGGLTSVSGAVLGTLTISVVLESLRAVERGVNIGSWLVPSRPGLTEVGLALLLLTVLTLRPAGLTGGQELRLPGGPRGWRRRTPRSTGAGAEPVAPTEDRATGTTAATTPSGHGP